MKKKSLIKLALISLFALASCNGGNTTGSSSVETSSVETSSVVLPTATITFSQQEYSVERGEQISIRVRINFTNYDELEDETKNNLKKTVNFSLDQEKTYVSFDSAKGNDNPGSLTITGNLVGSAVLTATFTGNPDCKASVTINCVKRIPALKSVWSKVITNDSYTLNTYRSPTDDEINDEDLSEDDKVPYGKIISTDKTIENYVYDKETKKFVARYHTYDDENKVTGDVYGAALDTKGYAFYLEADLNGNLKDPGSIIKTSNGLLDSTNYKGLGENATSPNDVGTFFGLEAINPSWLPTEKVSGNIYEIAGDDTDEGTYLSCVEYMLWRLISPDTLATFFEENPNISYYYQIADAVNTYITADSSSTVSIQLTVDEDNFYGEITDVGTTESAVPNVTTYLSTAVASYPELAPAVQTFVNDVKGNNYVMAQSSSYGYYYTYYTEKYVMVYYPTDYVTAYNAAAKEAGYTGFKTDIGFGYGFIKKSDGIHYFEYTLATETEDAKITVDDTVVVQDTTLELYQVDMTDSGVLNYLSNVNVSFVSGIDVYSLPTTTSDDWSAYGYSGYYYTQSYNFALSYTYWCYGSDYSSIIGSTNITGIKVTTTKDGDTTKTSKVEFMYCDGYYFYYTPTLTNFGDAENQCPANALLQAELAK